MKPIAIAQQVAYFSLLNFTRGFQIMFKRFLACGNPRQFYFY